MILQAYIDDSLDDTGVYVLAGYVASAESWAAFSKEWEAMLPWGTLNSRGEYHFKMSEMALSPERMSRVPAFHKIIHDHALMSIACIMNKNDVESAKRRVRLERSDLFRLNFNTHVLDLCLKLLLNTFHDQRLSHPDLFNFDGQVDFYFDDSSDKGVVLNTWDEHMKFVPEERRALYGATPRFESDNVFLPLQAADFRAWWTRKWAVESGAGKFQFGGYPFATAAKSLPNMIVTADQDKIIEMLVESIRNDCGPDIPIVIDDEYPVENPDGPFPVQRLFSSLKRIARGLFRRPA
jgi:hypothetical protein